MKSKMKLIVTILALLVSSNLAFGQIDRSSDTKIERENPNFINGANTKVPTLGCCKCLDGANSLDLSTISGNAWTVNGSPFAFPTSINSAWNLSTGAGEKTALQFADIRQALDLENIVLNQTPRIENYGVANSISDVMKKFRIKLDG